MTVNAALLILMMMVAIEMLKLTVKYFFGKLTANNYLTKEDCEKCPAHEQQKEIVVIKKILMAMALKMGIEENDLGEDIKNLL